MAFTHDLRFAGRMLRRSPLLSAAAVLTLAIGLAANLTIFSWLQALVYRPLSGVPEQAQLVVVDGLTRGGGDQRLSYPEFRDLTRALAGVDGLLVYTYQPFGLATGDHAERIWGQLVSANFFDVLRVKTALGRAFRADEEAEGAGPVAVISDALWRRRFSARLDVIGQMLQVNGRTLTIVGVAPPRFHGVTVGLLLDVWIPIGMQPVVGGGAPNRLAARDVRWLGAYARLSPSSSLATLRQALVTAGRQLSRDHPATNDGASFSANTLADAPWGGTTVLKPVLTVLMAVVAIVMVVTCANVAILLLVRSVERRREIATRLAIGADRRRLVRQLLIESVVLAVVAGAAGGLASFASARLFQALLPPTGFPIGFDFPIDARLLAVATALSVAAGLLFGLAPAMQAWSTPVVQILREESGTTAGGPRLLRRLLVGAQVALAVTLTSVAGILTSGLSAASRIDPGFETERLLVGAIDLSAAGYTPDRGRQLVRNALDRLAALPDVRSATVARRVPLNFGGRGLVPASIDGYAPAAGEDVSLALNHVGPDYLRTMRIPLLAGREFAMADDEHAQRVAIVSRSAARRYWKNGAALGERLHLAGSSVRVVGIAEDILQDQLTQTPFPAVLLPILQDYRPDVVLHVAAARDPAGLAPDVRRVIAGIDPVLPLYDVRTMREHMRVPTFPYRLASVLTTVFSALALLLAGIGLYAVMAHSVAERRAEIGLRAAIGASRRDIGALVMRNAATLVLGGAVAGLLLGAVLARAAAARLAGVDATNVAAYAAALLTTCGVAALAAAGPAWRAVNVQPIRALRG